MSERKYRDSNGVEMSLGRLVVAEPEWAANQIRKAIGNEDRIAELEIRLAAEKESVGGCAVVVAKQKARIALLEAENQRLHAAARATVLEWRKDIWPGDEHKCFMNNRMEELAALVGEKV